MTRKKETQEQHQERHAKWLMAAQAALMPKHPKRHYGQNVVVRLSTVARGKLYPRNGARECARRLRQMGKEGIDG